MNTVALIGRFVRDPELRTVQNEKNVPVLNFTLAVDKPIKDAEANFIPCVAWRDLAERIASGFRKGDRIAIYGNINTRTYEDPKTGKRTIVEVYVGGFDYIEAKRIEAKPTDKPRKQEAPPEDNTDLPFDL